LSRNVKTQERHNTHNYSLWGNGDLDC
jgi:hypothetical protein